MIKKYLSKLYYTYFYSSALGYRFRKWIKKESIGELKPFSKNAVTSDLFVWRENENWHTEFELFNISSFLFPEESPNEDCEIHIFNSNGDFLKVINIILKAFELVKIKFNAISELNDSMGTFIVFHLSNIIPKVSEKGSHLMERGYVSYRRNNEVLNNFCHGNLQAISKKRNCSIKSIIGISNHDTAYHLQMIFSDCKRFELLYTNPSFSLQKIRIILRDKNNKIIKEIRTEVNSLGVQVLFVENSDMEIHTITNYGKIIMWRPVVMKFYKTHFDVLHG